MHIGIDYGSKLAGTTVLCYEYEDQLVVKQSEKKQDADQWLTKNIEELKPEFIFLDAPLTLPSAYFGKGENFFYRKCDVALKAMSPMFLGGLTARAMQLNNKFKEVKFIETYPKALVFQFENLQRLYLKKEKISIAFLKALIENLGVYENTISSLQNWHQVDAVMAWWSGVRFLNKHEKSYGNPDEGLIVI